MNLSKEALKAITEFYAQGVQVCAKHLDGQWCEYDSTMFHDALIRWNHYQGLLNHQKDTVG